MASLMLSSQYLLPTTVAYTAATVVGHAANDCLGLAGETLGVASEVAAVAKFAAHSAIYSVAYKKAFDASNNFCS